MKTERLIRFINGESSQSEKKEVLSWIHESEANKNQFIKLKNAWSLSTVHNKVPVGQIENAWQKLINNITREPRPGKQRALSLLKYAAVAVAAFGAALLLEKNLESFFGNQMPAETMSVINVPAGQGAQVKLPDGSTAYLNSDTKISYTNKFMKGKRVVKMEGEAYFEVTKDKTQPFIVETDELDIQVYGTSFNVEAYDNSPLSVILVEGSVGLNSKKGNQLIKIEPGEIASYLRKEKKILVKKVDTDLYTSWRKGIITFRNVPLSDIVGKIERWYNVEIEILSEGLKNQSYSGTLLKSKPVDQILEALSLTASFTYEIQYTEDAPTLIKLRKK